VGCLVCVSLLSCSYNGKRKYKITEELEGEYPCFRKGHQEWDAESLVCEPGTYVSEANKVLLIFEPRRNPVS
jgi:hypothetical protein